MVNKQTWLRVSDSSQAKWISVFHLYGGFYRRFSKSGLCVKGSVKIIQPFYDYYKGFTVKQIVKGRVSKVLITSQTYNYNMTPLFTARTHSNLSILLKKKFNFKSQHIIGPGFLQSRRKKFNAVFKVIL